LNLRKHGDDIIINQKEYWEQTIHKFGQTDAHSVKAPWKFRKDVPTKKECLATTTEEDLDMKGVPFSNLVMSLAYGTITRPEIKMHVMVLAQFMKRPNRYAWKLAINLLRYIKHDINKGIQLNYERMTNSPESVHFSDSDWAGDHQDRKSRTGGVSLLHGVVVHTISKKQTINAQSSTGAEYVALNIVCKFVVWFARILIDFGYEFNSKTGIRRELILGDNQSALTLTQKSGFIGTKFKHLQTKWNYVREQYENETIELGYVNSGDNLADIMTKVLPETQFIKLRDMLLGYTPLPTYKPWTTQHEKAYYKEHKKYSQFAGIVLSDEDLDTIQRQQEN
jgi:hypothetical protein